VTHLSGFIGVFDRRVNRLGCEGNVDGVGGSFDGLRHDGGRELLRRSVCVRTGTMCQQCRG